VDSEESSTEDTAVEVRSESEGWGGGVRSRFELATRQAILHSKVLTWWWCRVQQGDGPVLTGADVLKRLRASAEMHGSGVLGRISAVYGVEEGRGAGPS
jgi:hypothetical protein